LKPESVSTKQERIAELAKNNPAMALTTLAHHITSGPQTGTFWLSQSKRQPNARIMLSTMCRVGELAMARWEHVDLDAAESFIPKENTKDKQSSLDIFLSPFALAQFRALKEISRRSDWCFPARNNDRHVCVKSINKQVGDRQARFKKSRDGSPRKPMATRCHENMLVLAGGSCGAWTPHDLRRTGATLMQALGVSLEVIDHVTAARRRHHVRVRVQQVGASDVVATHRFAGRAQNPENRCRAWVVGDRCGSSKIGNQGDEIHRPTMPCALA
jgi:integrase